MSELYNFKKLEETIKNYPHREDLTRFCLLPLTVFATDAKVVVELGVGQGWSAEAIFFAVRERGGKLFLIDPTTPEDLNSRDDHICLKNLLKHPNVFHLRTDSIVVGREWDEEIDWLHIDTTHTYEQTKGELEVWYPHMKVGGLIVMHDSKLSGVERAVNEFLVVHADEIFFYNMKDNVHGLNFIRRLK